MHKYHGVNGTGTGGALVGPSTGPVNKLRPEGAPSMTPKGGQSGVPG